MRAIGYSFVCIILFKTGTSNGQKQDLVSLTDQEWKPDDIRRKDHVLATEKNAWTSPALVEKIQHIQNSNNTFQQLLQELVKDVVELENEVRRLKRIYNKAVHNNKVVIDNITAASCEMEESMTRVDTLLTGKTKVDFEAISSGYIKGIEGETVYDVDNVLHNFKTLDDNNSSFTSEDTTVNQQLIFKKEEYNLTSITKRTLNDTISLLCDPNWVYFKGRCYMFSNTTDKRTWHDANHYCNQSSKNGYFLEIDSDKEMQFIMSKMPNAPSSVWIGAAYSLEEQIFLWEYSKSPVQWEYWSSGELAGDRTVQSCVALTKWDPVKPLYELYCGFKQRFVCEKALNSDITELPNKNIPLETV